MERRINKEIMIIVFKYFEILVGLIREKEDKIEICVG